MYISREIDKQLNEWKESKQHKPLLLRGARQVGKSSVVRHLGESFDYYIEDNFEKKSELKDLFIVLNMICFTGKTHLKIRLLK